MSQRSDGRRHDEFLKYSIQQGVISTAEGSAVVKHGSSSVMAAVKIELALEQPATNLILDFTAAPGCEAAEEKLTGCKNRLQTMLDAGDIIDEAQMVVTTDKANAFYVAYIDILVFEHDHGLIDTSLAAIMAALMDTTLPHLVEGAGDDSAKIVLADTSSKLHVKNVVSSALVAVGSCSTGECCLYPDPLLEELSASVARLRVFCKNGNFCSMELDGFVDENTMKRAVSLSESHSNKLFGAISDNQMEI